MLCICISWIFYFIKIYIVNFWKIEIPIDYYITHYWLLTRRRYIRFGNPCEFYFWSHWITPTNAVCYLAIFCNLHFVNNDKENQIQWKLEDSRRAKEPKYQTRNRRLYHIYRSWLGFLPSSFPSYNLTSSISDKLFSSMCELCDTEIWGNLYIRPPVLQSKLSFRWVVCSSRCQSSFFF